MEKAFQQRDNYDFHKKDRNKYIFVLLLCCANCTGWIMACIRGLRLVSVLLVVCSLLCTTFFSLELFQYTYILVYTFSTYTNFQRDMKCVVRIAQTTHETTLVRPVGMM